jgi:hypothetical protein
MKKSNVVNTKPVTTLAPDDRNREIKRLERERQNVTSAIELVMGEIKKAGFRPAPPKRKYPVGKGPQDFKGDL